jgi:hypothetical protein
LGLIQFLQPPSDQSAVLFLKRGQVGHRAQSYQVQQVLFIEIHFASDDGYLAVDAEESLSEFEG